MTKTLRKLLAALMALAMLLCSVAAFADDDVDVEPVEEPSIEEPTTEPETTEPAGDDENKTPVEEGLTDEDIIEGVKNGSIQIQFGGAPAVDPEGGIATMNMDPKHVHEWDDEAAYTEPDDTILSKYAQPYGNKRHGYEVLVATYYPCKDENCHDYSYRYAPSGQVETFAHVGTVDEETGVKTCEICGASGTSIQLFDEEEPKGLKNEKCGEDETPHTLSEDGWKKVSRVVCDIDPIMGVYNEDDFDAWMEDEDFYEDPDAFWNGPDTLGHRVCYIETFEQECEVCGQIIEWIDHDYVDEPHQVSNNKCVICGYRFAATKKAETSAPRGGDALLADVYALLGDGYTVTFPNEAAAYTDTEYAEVAENTSAVDHALFLLTALGLDNEAAKAIDTENITTTDIDALMATIKARVATDGLTPTAQLWFSNETINGKATEVVHIAYTATKDTEILNKQICMYKDGSKWYKNVIETL